MFENLFYLFFLREDELAVDSICQLFLKDVNFYKIHQLRVNNYK